MRKEGVEGVHMAGSSFPPPGVHLHLCSPGPLSGWDSPARHLRHWWCPWWRSSPCKELSRIILSQTSTLSSNVAAARRQILEHTHRGNYSKTLIRVQSSAQWDSNVRPEDILRCPDLVSLTSSSTVESQHQNSPNLASVGWSGSANTENIWTWKSWEISR